MKLLEAIGKPAKQIMVHSSIKSTIRDKISIGVTFGTLATAQLANLKNATLVGCLKLINKKYKSIRQSNKPHLKASAITSKQAP